jgi:hypothetical protein
MIPSQDNRQIIRHADFKALVTRVGEDALFGAMEISAAHNRLRIARAVAPPEFLREQSHEWPGFFYLSSRYLGEFYECIQAIDHGRRFLDTSGKVDAAWFAHLTPLMASAKDSKLLKIIRDKIGNHVGDSKQLGKDEKFNATCLREYQNTPFPMDFVMWELSGPNDDAHVMGIYALIWEGLIHTYIRKCHETAPATLTKDQRGNYSDKLKEEIMALLKLADKFRGPLSKAVQGMWRELTTPV